MRGVSDELGGISNRWCEIFWLRVKSGSQKVISCMMVGLGKASGSLMGVTGRGDRAKLNVSTGASTERRAKSFAVAIRRRNQ